MNAGKNTSCRDNLAKSRHAISQIKKAGINLGVLNPCLIDGGGKIISA